jgi:integrase
MDKGAIRRLRWQDLDLDWERGRVVSGRFAMQRAKTGKPVRQALTDGAVEALNRARKVRHPSGTVFLDAEGHPVAEKALDWAIGRAYVGAKTKGCNFRTFRHTFATRALRRGVPREVLAKMMGHSTAFITERYMHVADDQLEAAARAMSGPERLGGSKTAVNRKSDSGPKASEPSTSQGNSVV